MISVVRYNPQQPAGQKCFPKFARRVLPAQGFLSRPPESSSSFASPEQVTPSTGEAASRPGCSASPIARDWPRCAGSTSRSTTSARRQSIRPRHPVPGRRRRESGAASTRRWPRWRPRTGQWCAGRHGVHRRASIIRGRSPVGRLARRALSPLSCSTETRRQSDRAGSIAEGCLSRNLIPYCIDRI